jgi:hypothetical protein
MSKGSNYYVYRDDLDELREIEDQYKMLGRYTKIEGNKLTVFARKPVKPKKKDDNDRNKGRSPRPTRD